MRLENILQNIKGTAKSVLILAALYGTMEAHYRFPENFRAVFRQDKSTPSSIFRTETVSEKAINYQSQLYGRYLGK